MKVRAHSQLADAVLPSIWRGTDNTWDGVLEEVDIATLVAEDITDTNGW